MALKLIVNIAKKVPGPQEYSSIQASCSIEGELAAGQDPVAECARIFRQAESAVDAQLQHGGSAPAAAPSGPASALAQQPAVRPQPTGPASFGPPRQQASQPYRGGGQRRGPAPVTDSQLRFLDRLIRETGASVDAILAEHQVGALNELSCKAAAGLIDTLKAQGTRA